MGIEYKMIITCDICKGLLITANIAAEDDNEFDTSSKHFCIACYNKEILKDV